MVSIEVVMNFTVIVPMPDNQLWDTCIEWCYANIGNPLLWTYHCAGEFSFEKERDAVMFSLRWS